MSNKIHPFSFRLGITKDWPSRWFFASGKGKNSGLKSYATLLPEDEAIRRAVKKKAGLAGIVSVEIERTGNALKVMIRAAKPGLIIGRGGKGIEDLSRAVEKELRKVRPGRPQALNLNVEELRRSEVSAVYVAQTIAWDLERRIPFRQAMNKQLDLLTQNRDIKGAKIAISGRLDGAEISRREWKSTGSIPLQKLRADIDFGEVTAFPTYGAIGIKVWIYKGEIFQKRKTEKNDREANQTNP